MFSWDMKKWVIFSSVAISLAFGAGFASFMLYQPQEKTEEIYRAALEDFKKGDYQNSYYLYSKVGYFSDLKPVAIYHRAECAKMLGDSKSEVKQYEFLFNNYPKHVLSLKSRYLAGQKLFKDKPQVAKKYFKYIIEKHPESDFAIASEYYLALILIEEAQGKIPKNLEDNIQNKFRYYLTKAPAGRLAFNVVKSWLEFTDNISKEDYLLMANTAYIFGDYKLAEELLSKTELKNSWTLKIKNAKQLKDFNTIKDLTEEGLGKYSAYVSEDDVIDAIDIYLSEATQKRNATERLYEFATGKGKDYLLNLVCDTKVQKDKLACYNQLYLKYPDGRFSADAMSNIFFAKIKSGDFIAAKKIGKDYLNKFSNTKSAPMVMFWMGKIYEKTGEYQQYSDYYKQVITSFPDSYYAYRAYLRLNKMQGPLITSFLNPQPVVYPYKYTNKNIIVKLVELGDYDIIGDFSNGDEFIKSWVLYKKGDYSHSILVARDAMEKIVDKPDKYDLRWRLVYPIIYYEDIRKFSGETGNNLPLMLGLIREESYFDPLAQSVVGASGLMQIMPSTASEINSRFNLGLNISSDIFNPYLNIKLGNYYYEFLRTNLEGYDISSVAAYNGGIGSLRKWKTTLHYNDTDEFVEQIPYLETRNYVKKVFRSYWNYVRIYSGNE